MSVNMSPNELRMLAQKFEDEAIKRAHDPATRNVLDAIAAVIRRFAEWEKGRP